MQPLVKDGTVLSVWQVLALGRPFPGMGTECHIRQPFYPLLSQASLCLFVSPRLLWRGVGLHGNHGRSRRHRRSGKGKQRSERNSCLPCLLHAVPSSRSSELPVRLPLPSAAHCPFLSRLLRVILTVRTWPSPSTKLGSLDSLSGPSLAGPKSLPP